MDTEGEPAAPGTSGTEASGTAGSLHEGTDSTSGTTVDSGIDADSDTDPNRPKACSEIDPDLPPDGGNDDGATSGAEDTGAGMGGDLPIGASIFELGALDNGLRIRIDDVVVTTPVHLADGQAVFFVQDLDGGLGSGAKVILEDLDLPELEPGQVIDIVGRNAPRGVFRSIVLAESNDEVFVSAQSVALPEPIVISIEQLEQEPEALVDLESVLVRFEALRVEAPTEACPGQYEADQPMHIDDMFLSEGEKNQLLAEPILPEVIGPLLEGEPRFRIAPRDGSDFGS
jgi:hypothetical protein